MAKEKVVIVTGADHGIGAGVAHHLLERNMRVVIADIQLKNKKAFPQDEEKVAFIKTDVSDEVSVKNLIKQTIARFGQIDALINNAGIVISEKRVPLKKSRCPNGRRQSILI